MERAAEGIIKKRIFLLLLAAVVTVLAVVGMTRLTFDDHVKNLFDSDDEAFELLDRVFEDFGSDDRDCLMVIESDQMFTPDALAYIHDVEVAAKSITGVKRVYSMLDALVFTSPIPRKLIPAGNSSDEELLAAKEAALVHPLISSYLLSDDASTAIVIVELDSDIEDVDEIAPIVINLNRVLKDALNTEHGKVIKKARLTGVPPLRVEIIESVRAEQIRILLLGSILGIALAFIIFRHIATVAIVTGVPIIGAIWTLGLLGWVNESVNVINAVIPTLVMVIGFTDSVHLIVDMRRSRANGLNPKEASKDAIRHLGIACSLTSLTTFVGFGSLVAASIGTIQRFGMGAAAGTVVTFIAVIILVPTLASFVSTPHFVSVERFKKREIHRKKRVILLEPFLRHPRIASILGIGITLLLAGMAMNLRPDNRLSESIPLNRPSTSAMQHCDETMGGILQIHVLVDWPKDLTLASPEVLNAFSRIHDLIDKEPRINHPISILSVFQSMPGGVENAALSAPFLKLLPYDLLSRFVREDLYRGLITARSQDVGAIKVEAAINDLEKQLVELKQEFAESGDFQFRLTGTTVVASRNVRLMIGDLAKSLGIAAIVIFAVLTIAFKSLRLGLISIIPNVFPLVATGALLVLIGKPLQITSVIVFSVCLGIAVDDTIHFLTRFVRERKADESVSVSNAVRRTFVAVGTALIITTVVLLFGFGAGMISEIPGIMWFAYLSCFAIASALLGDLFILPALINCFVKEHKKTAPSIKESS